MSERNKTVMEMAKLLSGLSIDELQALKPLFLKGLERLNEREVMQYCANGLIDLVIQIKQAELGVVQCKSRS